MIPLSKVLRKVKAGYSLGDVKTNHHHLKREIMKLSNLR